MRKGAISRALLTGLAHHRAQRLCSGSGGAGRRAAGRTGGRADMESLLQPPVRERVTTRGGLRSLAPSQIKKHRIHNTPRAITPAGPKARKPVANNAF